MQEQILGSGGSYVIDPKTHEAELLERTKLPGEASAESSDVDVDADAGQAAVADAPKTKADAKKE